MASDSPTSPPPTQPVPWQPARETGRRRRQIIGGIAIAVVVLVGASVLAFGYVALKLNSVSRVTVAGLHPLGPGSSQTILLTGSDTRAGESAGQAQQFGSASQVTGQRSDVIVLIRFNPGTGKAAMLSIPRDMFVPISGTSSSNRINSAFNSGPDQLIATIEQDFGITINHYAQEDFSGLQAMTDAVGGVCMNFPYPARDGSPIGSGNESGLTIPTAGHHTLHGAMALALVRSRYYLYFTNRGWQADGTGDIGRIQRQHSFMRALASKAFHASLRNPFTANTVLSKAVREVRVDNSFTTFGLMRLGLALRSVHPSGIPSFTMPYRVVNNFEQFGDVLMPEPAQDAAVVAAWEGSVGSNNARTTPSTISPANITLKVLNGSGTPGQARLVADDLRSAGFQIGGFGNAASPQQGATIVTYGPGLKDAAAAVAGHLRGPVTVRADKAAGTTVVVTTGTSFQGVTPPPLTPPAAGRGTAAGGAAGATEGTLPPWDPTPC